MTTEYNVPVRPAPLLERSEKIGALAVALAKAQAEFTEIERNCKGQSGNRTFFYADFAAIRAATNPALTKYGLALLSSFAVEILPVRDGGPELARVWVQTELIHGESEQYLRTPVVETFVPEADVKAQGGATSYFRRYQARTLLGVADEEADGEGERLENARSAPPPVAGSQGGNFRCAAGQRHTSAQGAKECPGASAHGAGDGTLEPGKDPASMNGPVDESPTVKQLQDAVGKKDWKACVQILSKLSDGEMKRRLTETYNAARFGQKEQRA
jgi:hypothetical protein